MSTGLPSITLQTDDANITSGDIVGRINFLSSNETDNGDAKVVAASIFAEAENSFTSTTNQTAIIFATANDNPADAKLKITGSGHFYPVNTRTSNIGSSSSQFANINVASGNYESVILANIVPASTTNALYNNEIGRAHV